MTFDPNPQCIIKINVPFPNGPTTTKFDLKKLMQNPQTQ